jgi:hypothetical protein
MFYLIQVWSESKHDFLGSSASMESLMARYPDVTDWKPNGVGGVTSRKTGLVIKKAS